MDTISSRIPIIYAMPPSAVRPIIWMVLIGVYSCRDPQREICTSPPLFFLTSWGLWKHCYLFLSFLLWVEQDNPMSVFLANTVVPSFTGCNSVEPTDPPFRVRKVHCLYALSSVRAKNFYSTAKGINFLWMLWLAIIVLVKEIAFLFSLSM